MSIPESGSETLTGRLARIRQRLQRDPAARIDDSAMERWADAGPLMQLNDEEFVRAAYVRLFRREPDLHGLRHNADQLRAGRMTKPELLTALAQSPEGREYGVRFVGMNALPLQHTFQSTVPEPEQFVRALGRYYNGQEPADDSLARWVELLETESLSRDEVVQLFAASAQGSRMHSLAAVMEEVDAVSSTMADMRQELEWHQRAVESLLPRQR